MKYCLIVCAFAVAVLSGCGGGGGGDVPAPVTPVDSTAPVIRYSALYSSNNNTLTISPIAGASSIATRGVGSVQVRANGVLLPALTTPNTTTAAGQAAFLFQLPDSTLPPVGVKCAFPMRLEITATDSQGLSFNKYVTPCEGTQFGGFSDYGDRTLTFRITANTPVTGFFGRESSTNPVDASDTGRTVPGEGSKTWAAVPAREGDKASIGAVFPDNAPDNAQVDVSIESNGVVLASSRATKASFGASANANVACCQGSAPSATASRTVNLLLVPSRLDIATSRPEPFNVHYRVYNTAAQQVVQEFTGTPAGITLYSFFVRPGDELTLEASPLTANAIVDMHIQAPNNGVAEELGLNRATVPNVPAVLHVFCCSR